MRTFTVSTVAALSLLSLVAASPLHRPGDVPHDHGRAPVYTPPNPWAAAEVSAQQAGSVVDDSHLIPDSYIVVLKEPHGHKLPFHLRSLEARLSERLSKRGVLSDFVEGVAHHFSIGDFIGYAGKFSQDTLDFIRSSPLVDFVERDSVVKAMDLEKGAPWGLARISHRKPLSLGTLGKYEYAHNGGEGVDVYVIDTGINVQHVEFEGRAKWGKTMPMNDVDADGNGHGTHCAGTIASAKYGVAKAANLIAVKVLGSSGSGSMSDVVGGVAWAASAAKEKLQSKDAKSGKHKGSVANMSLGGGKSQALDLAVNRAVKAGLHFAVAAGNDNRDACSYSPAGAEEAITVGASTISDSRAYFSNFGKCVDIFAPGLNILSTWNTGNRSINTISGTSMASPHIAGLTAYYLSLYASGDFVPTEQDYLEAGVPVPGSKTDQDAAAGGRSLFSKGGQLVFGHLFGNKKDDGFKGLDPRVLKKTMLRLSTKDILTQIPADGTPNYLAFNNYTGSANVAEAVEEEMFHAQPIFEKGEAMVENAFETLEEMIEEIVEEDLKWLVNA